VHVHIGRSNLSEKQIENIVYLVNHNHYEWSKLSGRHSQRRAPFYIDDESWTCIDKWKRDRYSAVNLTNNKTIEIRTFKNDEDTDIVLWRIELTMVLEMYCKKNRQFSWFISECKKACKKYGFTSLAKLLKENGYN